MPRKGFVVITIHSITYKKAYSLHEQKIKSKQIDETKSFSRYINDLIIERIEADEALSLSAPLYEKEGLSGNVITLKDNKRGHSVDIQIRAKERDLYCLFDNRNDCVHVGFSYAIPEVYRVMKNIKRKQRD